MAQPEHLPLDSVGPVPSSADFGEVSTATRLLGDRWSLLVVRELALGNDRFADLHAALPELSRSLLASRLRYLARAGIVERRPFSGGDRRTLFTYALTPGGWGLVPVLRALDSWARTWRGAGGSLDPVNVPGLIQFLTHSVDRAAVPGGRVSIQFRLRENTESPVFLRVDGSGQRADIGTTERPDLVVSSSLQTLSNLYWGTQTCGGAIDHGDIAFDGPTAYAEQFPQWFPNRPAVRESIGGGWRPVRQPSSAAADIESVTSSTP